jgi:hypothetical protein
MTESALAANEPELTSIDTAAQKVCNPDSRFARQLFDLCRAQAPDCTVEQVVAVVENKITIKRGQTVVNWIGYLLTAVPRQFEGKGTERFRTTLAAARSESQQSTAAFDTADRSAYLEHIAAALPAEYEEIAASLRELVTADLDLEALEQRLKVLEENMIATAHARQSDGEVLDSLRALEHELLPYRGKMTSDQLSMLEKQCSERNLLKNAGLPRLSLFHMP